MSKNLHSILCQRGDKWLKSIGCSHHVTEMTCSCHTGEIPDNIGWKSGYSILLECKTSRSDFLADKKKIFREHPDMGMGQYRLFLCPDDLIKLDELPEGWGLLYYSPDRKNLKRVVCFKGNILMDSGNLKCQLANFQAERALLLSSIRRMS